MTQLSLRTASAEVMIAPSKGGAILSFSIGGHDILRKTDSSDPDILETACFPLVPYANRICSGSFPFRGLSYILPPNFGDHPHPLHGLGWTSSWEVRSQSHNSATLSHGHVAGSAWPWSYEATQQISLSPYAVEICLILLNTDREAMPFGLGLHPYFPCEAGSRLSFRSEGVWLTSPDLIPTELSPAARLADWSPGNKVSGEHLIDNCYTGWDGSAVIEQPSARSLAIDARNAAFAHVYRPPSSDFFCFEPVTHAPNAFNHDDGVAVLEPGKSAELEMRVSLLNS